MDFQEVGLGSWTGFLGFRKEQRADTCECVNEPSCFIKFKEILD